MTEAAILQEMIITITCLSSPILRLLVLYDFIRFNLNFFFSLVHSPNSTAIVYVKFIFSKKTTKIDKILTIDLTFTTKSQIDGEDFCQFLWPS